MIDEDKVTAIYCPNPWTALAIVNALSALGVETEMNEDHFVVTERLDSHEVSEE